MLGFVVTPTTCRSRTNPASVPETSRSRDRSSSQIATPASDSCFKVWMLTLAPNSVAGGRTLGRADLRQRRVRRGDDALRRQAELFVEDLVRRARAEVVEAEGLAGIADDFAPSERRGRLDRHPSPHV